MSVARLLFGHWRPSLRRRKAAMVHVDSPHPLVNLDAALRRSSKRSREPRLAGATSGASRFDFSVLHSTVRFPPPSTSTRRLPTSNTVCDVKLEIPSRKGANFELLSTLATARSIFVRRQPQNLGASLGASPHHKKQLPPTRSRRQ